MRADGLVGVYAHRVLDRGGDLRALAADARAARFGVAAGADRHVRVAAALPVGRGTERHRRLLQTTGPSRKQGRAAATSSPRASRRLVAAGLVALVALPFAALMAYAEPAPSVATLDARSSGAARIVRLAADIDVAGPSQLARGAP
ncbi:MAG TPA: hypothetical protein VFI22_02765 [Thermomicrobiales bacterium]|nr:hypothetical protein [Thermomicrobiales bacterium]